MPRISGIHLIDLDQKLPGQRLFISCWARLAETPTFLVDPGPPATADRLIRTLEELGLRQLDFILLTHIHLDHGGATAPLLARWPEAKVVCHPRGRSHLARPDRLWAGSRKVLGSKALVYGEPQPVPAAALVEYAEARAHGIEVRETPGHAPHHLCFRLGEDLFLGEAAGTFSTLGQDSSAYYLRPATPSRFDLEIAQHSLLALIESRPVPGILRFAHHGAWQGDTRALLRLAHDQLALWVDVCREVTSGRGIRPEDFTVAAVLDAIVVELRRRDPAFQRGSELPADIQEREADFTRQSLRGMLDYLVRQL